MKEHYSLLPHNSFGINATARYFIEIQSCEELLPYFSELWFKELPKLVLGGGNNILFCNDRFDGVVLHLKGGGYSIIEEDENIVVIRVHGGTDWPTLVADVVAHSWYGIENLAAIPGSVGAAPVQNIGAYGVELKDVFVRCHAIDLSDGSCHCFTKEECEFGYRESIFKTIYKGRYMIYSVDLMLKKKGSLKLSYGDITSCLAQAGITRPTIQQVFEIITEIRKHKLPDVKKLGNAGSFFKNPIVEPSFFEELRSKHPKIPHYLENNGGIKIPAGWLIEQAGWKGFRDGPVGVYDKQALVLVHYGGGKGSDIAKLSKRIIDSVYDMFDIIISAEVNFIGSDGIY